MYNCVKTQQLLSSNAIIFGKRNRVASNLTQKKILSTDLASISCRTLLSLLIIFRYAARLISGILDYKTIIDA